MAVTKGGFDNCQHLCISTENTITKGEGGSRPTRPSILFLK